MPGGGNLAQLRAAHLISASLEPRLAKLPTLGPEFRLAARKESERGVGMYGAADAARAPAAGQLDSLLESLIRFRPDANRVQSFACATNSSSTRSLARLPELSAGALLIRGTNKVAWARRSWPTGRQLNGIRANAQCLLCAAEPQMRRTARARRDAGSRGQSARVEIVLESHNWRRARFVCSPSGRPVRSLARSPLGSIGARSMASGERGQLGGRGGGGGRGAH